MGWLERSLAIKEKLKIVDPVFGKILFDLALSYNSLGDYDKVVRYALEYIGYESDVSGKYTGDIAEEYAFLSGVSFENKNYEDFVSYSFKALDVLSSNPQALQGTELRNLYCTIGSGYIKMGDYAKGRIYLEEAENIFKKYESTPDKEYINLINSLAITYGSLGLAEKESEYFNKGVELADYDKSVLSFNMLNTYAIGLGKAGKTQKGETLLKGVTEKAKSRYGTDSRFYAEILNDYASFLLNYTDDPHNALKAYSECIDFLNLHRENKNLKITILPGYADALYHCGYADSAIKIIQKILFNTDNISNLEDPYPNPSAGSLRADKTTLNLLSLKYDILSNLFKII